MDEEIWVDIEEFNGYYQVSDQGRVKSKERTIIRRNGKKQLIPECILKPMINRHGYLKVRLYGEAIIRTRYIHVLVAESFIGERPGSNYVVCHNDGVKLHNTLENLRYDTYAENFLDAVKHGAAYVGERSKLNKVKEADIIEIKKLAETKSQKEIADIYGISQQQVSRIIRGKNWKWIK